MEILEQYLLNSSLITIIVLAWLSLYFIVSVTILLSRYGVLNLWIKREKVALESLLLGAKVAHSDSVLRKFSSDMSREKFAICQYMIQTKSTSGLTWLNIIASTSPFIGLFGTVIGILETFSKLSEGSGASLNIIAPAISEALVATGCGIFVAIPAYTFSLIIKRKAYELINIINQEVELLVSIK